MELLFTHFHFNMAGMGIGHAGWGGDGDDFHPRAGLYSS